jgi:ABC-type dipeptide/oligopeptide/nickel transport system ATPase component
VPDLHALGTGCRFADRCPQVHARCRAKEPPLAAPDRAAGPGRKVRCWLHREAD